MCVVGLDGLMRAGPGKAIQLRTSHLFICRVRVLSINNYFLTFCNNIKHENSGVMKYLCAQHTVYHGL